MATPSFSSIEKWILQRIHAAIGHPPIRLALGRGPEILLADIEPLASVLISDWSTLARLVLNPEIGFGDGYSEGRIEVEGDLVLLMETVLRSMKDAATMDATKSPRSNPNILETESTELSNLFSQCSRVLA